MNDTLLQLYHHLPAFTRSIVSSLYGYYLRFCRYGPETELLVEKALAREQWSIERWKIWQEEKLSYVLHRAATQVPYYRAQWAERRRKGDRISWEYLENWPILEKEPLQKYPNAFIADNSNVRKMHIENTSGSTGKPLCIWKSRETLRAWYSLAEARWRRWYGVSQNDRWAILGGQLIVPITKRQPPFWVWNAAFKQLYMSSYHLAGNFVKFYVEALKEYDIQYIYAYSSSAFALAKEYLHYSGIGLNISVVITNAEPIKNYQRIAITKAFKCPVRETYGMTEIVAAASECEDKSLHFWPEVGYVEVVDGNNNTKNNIPGDLVCTGLLNLDMPLIRYRVGDRGILRNYQKRCSCGRSLPIIEAIEGRNDDVLYTSDGRCIGRLDPIFKGDIAIREAQIIQEELDKLKVRYVPMPDFTSSVNQMLRKRIQDRMGAIEVIFEEVAQIPRSANGKFRAVICKLPMKQRKINEHNVLPPLDKSINL